MTRMHPEFEKIIVTEEEVQQRVTELAAQISADYPDQGSIVLIGILKGAFMFISDLARQLTIPHHVDFMALSSYGDKSTSGAVRIVMDLRADITNKHVVIVEDIMDTGNTIQYLFATLQSRHPASIKTCVLTRKASTPQDILIDYLGFEIPDVWVVGYGLDLADRHRTWPFIAELKKSSYE